MNRDWFAQTQPEVRGRIAVGLDWVPQVTVDLHEQGGNNTYYFAPPAEALNRFHVVFEAFVRAFATEDHPLTLFLDDLQWADLPSLQLLARFLTDAKTRHFLCVGAYRDN